MRRAMTLLLSGLCACYVGEPCDPGQRLDRDKFGCVAVDTSTAAAPQADEEPTGSDEMDTTPDACEGPELGDPCEVSEECTCEADFCAVEPGQPMGFCTFTRCSGAPEVCTAGFSCLDISVFAPELESICVPD